MNSIRRRTAMARAKGLWLAFVSAGLSLFVPSLAAAQTYTTTTTGAIGTGTDCAASAFLNRTINVPDSVVITDLDFGFLATHPYRGDIRMTLIHPDGTQRQLIDDETSGTSQDNYNVVLDDASATLINTAPHNTNDGTSAPPYENRVRPNAALSIFNGKNAQGNWTVRICDNFQPNDTGTFQRADLFVNPASAPVASSDLSLTMTSSNTVLTPGQDNTFTLTLTNSGPDAVSGVTVSAPIVTGLPYVSDNGGGAYVDGTGVWTVPGSIASGTSRTLEIIVTGSTSGATTFTAEVTNSSNPDPDSTPNNSGTVPGEDDTATRTLTLNVPPADTPPAISCPIPTKVFDWGASGWTAGSLTGSATVDGLTVTTTFTGDTGFFVNNAAFGGQTPLVSNLLTGGLGGTPNTLLSVVNFTSPTQSLDMELDLGTPGEGVNDLQFSVFDVDRNPNAADNINFYDRLTVVGFLGTTSVTPILSSSEANTATGNVFNGITEAASNSSVGNITITFQDRVDRVVLTYDNDPAVASNPGQQGVGIHSFNVCGPYSSAELAATKTNEVYDPAGAGLFALPGNDILYTIEVTNIGDGPTDANSVVLIDEMPPQISFFNGDVDGPGPHTNPVGFTQSSGAGLTFNYATDVGFWNGPVKPSSFAGCSYTPAAGYDASVTYICFNPKGQLQSGTPDPSFAVSFRSRIN